MDLKKCFGKTRCVECGSKLTTGNKTKLCRYCRIINHMKNIKNKSVSKHHMSSGNPFWKGDGVGNKALHRWVERRIKKPRICPVCKKRRTYDLTNNGIYSRDLKQWQWMCRHCHMTKDGRMKNLKQYS